MNMTRLSMLAALLALGLVGPNLVSAEDKAAPSGPVIYRFGDLKDLNVDNQKNEKLGEIEDIVYDTDSGRITYAAVSFGGFLGVGDKMFAVPWHALKPELDTVNNKHHIRMNADKESLKDAPGFDTAHWPNVGDAKWSADVDKFYPAAVGTEAQPAPRATARASALVGMNVKNSQGENLGEVKDVVFDISKGQIGYVAVSFGGFLGVGEKLFAVPFQALDSAKDGNSYHLVLNIDKATLEKAPSFDKNSWPNFADPNWARDIDAAYGNRTPKQ
ncbi:MAG: PRC-barrel domain-containing protein [Planctomycetia bacterium]|nr:PRC-barrel domain-containing protein [Planctomycetia bacterium]